MSSIFFDLFLPSHLAPYDIHNRTGQFLMPMFCLGKSGGGAIGGRLRIPIPEWVISACLFLMDCVEFKME